MSKILNKEKKRLGEKNSFHISQIKPNIDSLIATHAADDEAHHSENIRESCTLFPANGAEIIFGYIRLNAVNDDVYATFYVDSYVDDGVDMVFSFIHRCTSPDATVAAIRFVAANAVGSEDFNFNVDAGTGISLQSTVANRFYKTDVTITAANFESGDLVTVFIRLNEAGREVRIHTASLLYRRKSS